MVEQTINHRTWTIYRVTCIPNKKIYIGLTVDTISQRWTNHVCRAMGGHGKYAFPRAIRKYGRTAFKIEAIEFFDSLEKANNAEKRWIAEFNCLVPNGYNIAHGGGGTVGVSRKHSFETKQKISKAHKGKVFSEETRKKMRIARIGWKPSAELIERVRAASKGRVMSDETKRRLSQSKTGVKVPKKSLTFFYKALASLDAGTSSSIRTEGNRFSTRIVIDGKRTHLGMFKTAELAVAAYRNAILQQIFRIENLLRALVDQNELPFPNVTEPAQPAPPQQPKSPPPP